MGKVTVAEFLSLDGGMEEPLWTFPYWNGEIARFKHSELFASDALLLGRKTYEGFAKAWPARSGVDDFADRMNCLPKYVVSTTLEKAMWQNSTIIKRNVGEEIGRLRAQPGGNLLISGSGTLINYLMEQNLIDEYRLLIYPIVLGKGQRLFPKGTAAKLKLVESQRFSSGVIATVYQPA
ncbi:MAG: dihydrofolate reductase family protein [Caldilineaceae bacterium]